MTLTRRTPMRRTGGPARTGGPKPVGRKAQREAGALVAFRAKVKGRTWCEGNAITCSGVPHFGHWAHHVWPSDRRIGLHDPERGLLLCDQAHRFVHANPEWSYEHRYLGRAS